MFIVVAEIKKLLSKKIKKKNQKTPPPKKKNGQRINDTRIYICNISEIKKKSGNYMFYHLFQSELEYFDSSLNFNLL